MSVKVVGLDAVCASGLSKEEIFASCVSSQTAIDENGFASLSKTQLNSIAEMTPAIFKNSKCTLMSFRAIRAALEEAAWSAGQLAEAGFVFASTTSQIDEWEIDLPSYRHSGNDVQKIRSSVEHQSLGAPLLHLSDCFGIHGPRALISSSCSSSLQALAVACSWIRSQKVKRCLVGGTEINCTLTRLGFESLRLLSKSNCKPFDKDRQGINLGEGSAFLCLEAADIRSEKCWGFLTGYGLSTDAYHPTAPHPEGQGSQNSMLAALKDAGLTSRDISWIYAHGTGSPANDLAEARAINKIFDHRPLVSSTKSSHGHTLGACGAIESVLGLMAMKKNIVLPTFNFKTEDPEISLGVSSQKVDKNFQHFLKNSLGFGGINASLIFSKEVEAQ